MNNATNALWAIFAVISGVFIGWMISGLFKAWWLFRKSEEIITRMEQSSSPDTRRYATSFRHLYKRQSQPFWHKRSGPEYRFIESGMMINLPGGHFHRVIDGDSLASIATMYHLDGPWVLYDLNRHLFERLKEEEK